MRFIDGNVTARTGDLHIKKFTEERELTVVLVVDVSASGTFGSVEASKRELAAELAAMLAFSAIRNQDKVGLILFSDDIELFVPPRKGRLHVLRHHPRSALLPAARPPHEHRGGAGLSEQGHHAALGGVPDLGFPIAGFHAGVVGHEPAARSGRGAGGRSARRTNCRTSGCLSLEDAETGALIEINTSDRRVRAAFINAVGTRRAQLDTLLRRNRVDCITLRTDQDYLPGLARLFPSARTTHRPPLNGSPSRRWSLLSRSPSSMNPAATPLPDIRDIVPPHPYVLPAQYLWLLLGAWRSLPLAGGCAVWLRRARKIRAPLTPRQIGGDAPAGLAEEHRKHRAARLSAARCATCCASTSAANTGCTRSGRPRRNF